MEREVVEAFEAAKKAAYAAADGGGMLEEDRCVDALLRLRKIPVTMDILLRTQVGKHLRALVKHPQKKIQAVASDLLDYWKNVVIEETLTNKGDGKNDSSQGSSKPRSEAATRSSKVSKSDRRSIKIEKKSGSESGMKAEAEMIISKMGYVIKANGKGIDSSPPKLTSVVMCNDSVRDKHREILAEAFSRVYKETSESERDEVRSVLNDVDALDPLRMAVTIESALFERFGSSTGSHKLRYRSIMFNLKDGKNPDLRRRVLLGHVKPGELLGMTPEDMASDERKLANKQIKEKALFECERGATDPEATTDQFKCDRCGQRKCTYYQMQTRSADEPMTTYVTCVNCNHHWKFC